MFLETQRCIIDGEATLLPTLLELQHENRCT
ncbi:hypothetical protein VPHD528_0189 [Vibrio phage D528]